METHKIEHLGLERRRREYNINKYYSFVLMSTQFSEQFYTQLVSYLYISKFKLRQLRGVLKK